MYTVSLSFVCVHVCVVALTFKQCFNCKKICWERGVGSGGVIQDINWF